MTPRELAEVTGFSRRTVYQALQQCRIRRGSDGLIDAREAERILDATGYLTLRRAERLVAKQVEASTFDMLDMKEAQLNALLDEISREAELYLAEVSREAAL